MKKLFFLFSLSLLPSLLWAQGGGCDYSFSPPTGTNNTVNAIAVQADGNIILAGNFQKYGTATVNHIVRIQASNATQDATFNSGTGASGSILSCVIQPDDKIIIAGVFSMYNGTPRLRVARLNADGSLDTSFDPGTGTIIALQGLAYQPDGKILIGGVFSNLGGASRNNIARLNADGSLDTSFDPGTGTDDFVSTIQVQSDGKILIGGMFTTYNGTTSNGIARLNADGSLDASFEAPLATGSFVGSILVKADGKILAAGGSTGFDGTTTGGLLELEDDGSIDAGFQSLNVGTDGSINSMVVQDDGKIVIAGAFFTVNGVTRNRIARLNADGTQDLNFNPGAGANDEIIAMALQADGNILIGGSFTLYNNIGRKYLARIYKGCGLSFGVSYASICSGKSYTFNNHIYTTADTYIDTIQTALGCDSIVITLLSVNTGGTFNNPQTICQGNSYQVGTHTYTTTGVYHDTLQTAGGCDSIVVTQLTVSPTSFDNYQTICQGKSYSISTNSYSTTGTYTDVFADIGGCGNLTITTYLTVTAAPEYSLTNMICHGQSYAFNGHVYTSSGLYHDTVQTAQGCDSIVHTTLAVYQPDISVTQAGAELTAQATSSTYQWLDVNDDYAPIAGATDASYTSAVTGTYAVEVTTNSCVDTSASYQVVITGVEEALAQNSIQFAPNPAHDRLELIVRAGTIVRSVKILSATGQLMMQGQSLQLEVTALSEGMYFLLVDTEKGLWKETFIKE